MTSMNAMICAGAPMAVPALSAPETRWFAGLPARRPQTLEQAVQAAVEGLADGTLEPFGDEIEPPLVQTRAVLALLVRCYARQVYSSAAAARLAADDPDFSWCWWAAMPEAAALRRFRAANRTALHHCLMAALRFQVEANVALGRVTKANPAQLAKEADRRIIMAAFADSIGRDAE